MEAMNLRELIRRLQLAAERLERDDIPVGSYANGDEYFVEFIAVTIPTTGYRVELYDSEFWIDDNNTDIR